jgi:hypothetical protein
MAWNEMNMGGFMVQPFLMLPGLFRKAFPNQLQFFPARLCRLWIVHIETSQCFDDHMRNDESGIFFVIGRHDIPWSGVCACGLQTGLIGQYVLLPIFSFFNVGEAEFPIFLGFVNALKESLPLFLL